MSLQPGEGGPGEGGVGEGGNGGLGPLPVQLGAQLKQLWQQCPFIHDSPHLPHIFWLAQLLESGPTSEQVVVVCKAFSNSEARRRGPAWPGVAIAKSVVAQRIPRRDIFMFVLRWGCVVVSPCCIVDSTIS